MQNRINYSLVLIAMIVVFSSPVAALELDDNRIGSISQNCSSIISQLRNVQHLDAKERVSLGVQYESILSALMTNLNLRLVKNNQINAELAEQQSLFSSKRDEFKQDYIEYSQSLESLIAMDCREKPVAFYRYLEGVRERRQRVAEDVKELNVLIQAHKNTIVTIREGYNHD